MSVNYRKVFSNGHSGGTGDAPERYVEAIAEDAASEVERSLPYYLDTETRAQITAAVTAAVKSVLEG